MTMGNKDNVIMTNVLNHIHRYQNFNKAEILRIDNLAKPDKSPTILAVFEITQDMLKTSLFQLDSLERLLKNETSLTDEMQKWTERSEPNGVVK